MTPALGASPTLPTLEAARAADPDLPGVEPSELRALAALTLAARLQRRDVRVESIEVAPGRLASLPTEPPPLPSEFVDATHVVLGAVTERRRCTLCGVAPGWVACPFCSLGGCHECGFKGWLRCTACDGACEVAVVDARYVEDRALAVRLTFTPTLPPAVEALVRLGIDDAVDPPPSLRVELDAASAFAPYRAAAETTTEAGFQGHAFEDAFEHARAGLASLRAGGEIALEEIVTWARPFLVVTFPEVGEVAVVADGLGGVRVVKA